LVIVPFRSSIMSGDEMLNIPHSYLLSDALRTANPSSSAHSSTSMRLMGSPHPFLPQALKNTITTSTSGDIHLYADSATAADESPILFLDCEGFEGSDVPRGLRARWMVNLPQKEEHVWRPHTRGSFIHSAPASFSSRLALWQNQLISRGASYRTPLRVPADPKTKASSHRSFLSLIASRGGNKPDFDWSIESSSNAFLADEDVAELKNFYSTFVSPTFHQWITPGLTLY
jgi:hypothetical protein